MLISSYFALMDDAAPNIRAEAVGVLADAYLNETLGGEDPFEVDAALSMVLDDSSPKVRRTLAIAFAEQRDVPRHIVLSLAGDVPEVSALLIARSPLLTDADLIEIARSAEGMSLIAIALRQQVSGAVCAALVAREDMSIHLALVRNLDAEIAQTDLLTIAQAPGCSAEIREAILARPFVPATVRHALMVHVSRSLGGFAIQGGFVPEGRNARMIDDTIRDGTISIAAKQPAELKGFVAYLRHGAFLTPALILRSVLGGNLAFLAHAVAELSELDLARVTGLISGRSTAALSALFRRAGLPEFLEGALIEAVRAAHGLRERLPADALSLPVIQAAQASCILSSEPEGVRLLALLRRFEADAARAQSRRIADDLLARVRKERADLIAEQAPMPMLEFQELEIEPEPEPESDLAPEPVPVRNLGGGHRVVQVGDRINLMEAVPEVLDLAVVAQPVPMQLAAEIETGSIQSSSKLKTLIEEWRRESELRHPAPSLEPQAPANGALFSDWEIRGAA